MDSKEIEQLLEKYWLCETSLEEEQQLRDFFKERTLPGSKNETAAFFRFLEEEKNKTLSERFDLRVTKEIKERREGKLVRMSFTNVVRIAAGVLVLVAATYFVREEVRKSYPPELQDTYTDPQLAFEETKKALMMISTSFGKAKHEAEKIKVFNEAERKIQSKDSVQKETI